MVQLKLVPVFLSIPGSIKTESNPILLSILADVMGAAYQVQRYVETHSSKNEAELMHFY